MTSWQATTFLIGEYFTDSRRQPHVHRRRRPDLAAPERAAQLDGAQARGHEDARPADAAGAAYRSASARPASRCSRPPRRLATRHCRDRRAVTGERLSIGVPELDEMLGGGLPRGYSMLVAGPSGSGKSILADGLPGRRRAQRRDRRHRRVRAAPEPLARRGAGRADRRRPGRRWSTPARPTCRSTRSCCLLLDEIRRLGATRVVIDSLSGFELCLAPTFREDFRESLLRLVTRAGGDRRHRADDLRARGSLHRPALQSRTAPPS